MYSCVSFQGFFKHASPILKWVLGVRRTTLGISQHWCGCHGQLLLTRFNCDSWIDKKLHLFFLFVFCFVFNVIAHVHFLVQNRRQRLIISWVCWKWKLHWIMIKNFPGLGLIPAWIFNYIHHKMWDEITYPFPNFNGCTVDGFRIFINCFSLCRIEPLD